MEKLMQIRLIAFACLLLLSLSAALPVSPTSQPRRGRGRRYDERSSSCRNLRRLRAHEPSESESIRSEGGTFELSTGEDNEELDCAGVAFFRKTIESNAISIPQYPGAPELVYVARGEGRLGIVFPGCPETFREQSSFRGRSGRRSERQREEEEEEDSSQKVRRVRRGDVIAIFAGAVHWWYNDGNEPLQLVAIADTASPHNQLGHRRYRPFSLSGPGSSSRSPREEGEGEGRGIGANIFAGFNTRTLAEALGVELETARKLQQNQQSRLFARVERGRRLTIPGPRSRSQSRYPSPYERERHHGVHEYNNSSANGNENENGVEEGVCQLRVKHNADNPEDADIYVRDGGRMNIVNRFKLPLLRYLGLGAERVILRPRASCVPSWRMNAHGIMYVTRGEGRIEVVGDQGRRLFDGRVREGQFLVIPQFHAVMKQAGDEGLEWITFTTSDVSLRSSLAGRESVLKAMPEEVVSAAFRMDINEVREVMRNREDDTLILPPRHQEQWREEGV